MTSKLLAREAPKPEHPKRESMMSLMAKNAEQCRPKKGFNLVGVDDYELPGEQLFVIKSFQDLDEAKEAEAAYLKKHPHTTVYVYGPKGTVKE